MNSIGRFLNGQQENSSGTEFIYKDIIYLYRLVFKKNNLKILHQMKITSLFFLVFLFSGCNDKPDIRPQSNPLAVFPNPVREVVYIRFANPNNSPYTVVVFDTKGRILFEKNEDLPEPQYQVNVSTEPVGTYHVVLKRNNAMAVRQFAKTKE